MPALALPDPPLSDGTVALRGLEPSDVPALGAVVEPVVHRPQCDHLPDVCFARLRA